MRHGPLASAVQTTAPNWREGSAAGAFADHANAASAQSAPLGRTQRALRWMPGYGPLHSAELSSKGSQQRYVIDQRRFSGKVAKKIRT